MPLTGTGRESDAVPVSTPTFGCRGTRCWAGHRAARAIVRSHVVFVVADPGRVFEHGCQNRRGIRSSRRCRSGAQAKPTRGAQLSQLFVSRDLLNALHAGDVDAVELGWDAVERCPGRRSGCRRLALICCACGRGERQLWRGHTGSDEQLLSLSGS